MSQARRRGKTCRAADGGRRSGGGASGGGRATREGEEGRGRETSSTDLSPQLPILPQRVGFSLSKCAASGCRGPSTLCAACSCWRSSRSRSWRRRAGNGGRRGQQRSTRRVRREREADASETRRDASVEQTNMGKGGHVLLLVFPALRRMLLGPLAQLPLMRHRNSACRPRWPLARRVFWQ